MLSELMLAPRHDMACLADRRTISPAPERKEYRLPSDIAERLTFALVGYKNRDAARTLALFVARFWSSRTRLARPFPIDRRALADRDDLGLTEARIRGAIKTLEEVGFLHRGAEARGSVHRMTGAGELHRKPILFGFGPEYGPRFAAANARAERSRQRRDGKAVQGNPIVGFRRQSDHGVARMPVSELIPPDLPSPKNKNPTGYGLLMGEVVYGSPKEPGVGRRASSPELEAALKRFLEAWREDAAPPVSASQEKRHRLPLN